MTTLVYHVDIRTMTTCFYHVIRYDVNKEIIIKNKVREIIFKIFFKNKLNNNRKTSTKLPIAAGLLG